MSANIAPVMLRAGGKWLLPTAAVITVTGGAAIAGPLQRRREQEDAAKREQDRQMSLMQSYGARDSLEDLEAAVEGYGRK